MLGKCVCKLPYVYKSQKAQVNLCTVCEKRQEMFDPKINTSPITKNRVLNGTEYSTEDIVEVIGNTYGCLVEIRYYVPDENKYAVRLPNGSTHYTSVLGKKVIREEDPAYKWSMGNVSPHFTRKDVDHTVFSKFAYIAWYRKLEKYVVSRPLTVFDLISGSHSVSISGNDFVMIMDILDNEILSLNYNNFSTEIKIKMIDHHVYAEMDGKKILLSELLNKLDFLKLKKRIV